MTGPGAYFGMAGCLVLVWLVSVTPGLLLWVSWLIGRWSGLWVLIRLMMLTSGPLRIFGMLKIWLLGLGSIRACGGFQVTGAGVYLPAPELAMEGAVWGMVVDYGDARLDRCRASMPVPGPLQTVQRVEFWEGPFGLCRPFGLGTWVLIAECRQVYRSVA